MLNEDRAKHCFKNEWTLPFELMSFYFEDLSQWVLEIQMIAKHLLPLHN